MTFEKKYQKHHFFRHDGAFKTVIVVFLCLFISAHRLIGSSLSENSVTKDQKMHPSDFSFVMRDMGDMQALSEIARAMKNNGKKINILALGQSAYQNLRQDQDLYESVVIPDMVAGVSSQLGSKAGDLGGGQGHDNSFDRPADALILAQMLHAPVLITGVVSRAQAEIVNAARSLKSPITPKKIIGIYDSLAINKECFLFKDKGLRHNDVTGAEASAIGARPSFASQLDELWIPLAGLAVGISKATNIPRHEIYTSGSPSLEKSLHQLSGLEFERKSIRLNKLGANRADIIVFFAGGRDRPGQSSYAESFDTFVQASMATKQPSSGRFIFVVGLHPASNGDLEREVLARHSAFTTIRLLRTQFSPVTRNEISTNELIVASDIISTWNSTVASQAAMMEESEVSRRILFIDKTSSPDIFAVVEDGRASQLSDVEKIKDFFENSSGSNGSRNDFSKQIRVSTIEKIQKRLETLLH